MLKTIITRDKVIIEKMVELPVDVAAEVLTGYCNNKTNAPCVLSNMDEGELCPFTGTHCTDITADMWKEYLNG